MFLISEASRQLKITNVRELFSYKNYLSKKAKIPCLTGNQGEIANDI